MAISFSTQKSFMLFFANRAQLKPLSPSYKVLHNNPCALLYLSVFAFVSPVGIQEVNFSPSDIPFGNSYYISSSKMLPRQFYAFYPFSSSWRQQGDLFHNILEPSPSLLNKRLHCADLVSGSPSIPHLILMPLRVKNLVVSRHQVSHRRYYAREGWNAPLLNWWTRRCSHL